MLWWARDEDEVKVEVAVLAPHVKRVEGTEVNKRAFKVSRIS